MKELTIEQKAKAYDEAINRMKHYAVDEYGCSKIKVVDVFPELAKSEDERVRCTLINHFKMYVDLSRTWNGLKNTDILAWLEKQGEHANFRNKIQIGDKVTRNQDGILVNLSQLNRVAKKDEKQGEQKYVEWSEEDDKMLDTVIKDIVTLAGPYVCYRTDVDWLESLKDRVLPQLKYM